MQIMEVVLKRNEISARPCPVIAALPPLLCPLDALLNVLRKYYNLYEWEVKNEFCLVGLNKNENEISSFYPKTLGDLYRLLRDENISILDTSPELKAKHENCEIYLFNRNWETNLILKNGLLSLVENFKEIEFKDLHY